MKMTSTVSNQHPAVRYLSTPVSCPTLHLLVNMQPAINLFLSLHSVTFPPPSPNTHTYTRTHPHNTSRHQSQHITAASYFVLHAVPGDAPEESGNVHVLLHRQMAQDDVTLRAEGDGGGEVAVLAEVGRILWGHETET